MIGYILLGFLSVSLCVGVTVLAMYFIGLGYRAVSKSLGRGEGFLHPIECGAFISLGIAGGLWMLMILYNLGEHVSGGFK